MLLLMTRVYRHSFVKVHRLYMHRELYDRYFLHYKDFIRVSEWLLVDKPNDAKTGTSPSGWTGFQN